MIASFIFQPRYEPSYTVPFFITFGLVGVSFLGYVVFRKLLMTENKRRLATLNTWTEAEADQERIYGRGPVEKKRSRLLLSLRGALGERAAWIEEALSDERRGDERITFVYSL
jgi:hypothetical protein